MKREKEFNDIDKLGAYIIKSNLKATEKVWDKVILCNNSTWKYKETITFNEK